MDKLTFDEVTVFDFKYQLLEAGIEIDEAFMPRLCSKGNFVVYKCDISKSNYDTLLKKGLKFATMAIFTDKNDDAELHFFAILLVVQKKTKFLSVVRRSIASVGMPEYITKDYSLAKQKDAQHCLVLIERPIDMNFITAVQFPRPFSTNATQLSFELFGDEIDCCLRRELGGI